jgi:putative transposase
VLLPLIRGFVDERPTYGYRRIAALVNRNGRSKVCRRPTGSGSIGSCSVKGCFWSAIGRAGKAAPTTARSWSRSNLRWCSDGLEFSCWNGDVVRMAFIIDAFDREIIAWTAVCGAGISGSDVRDMMLDAVEKRFGTVRAPNPVEHLSDNGSPYTAKETRDFAAALNLIPCFTPIRSPESNGMSEAFVKTFKRDYLRINPLPDAQTALRQIAGWIDDYNEIHPHSALRMRSPRDFIRAQAQ